jgi:hypothetical protein
MPHAGEEDPGPGTPRQCRQDAGRSANPARPCRQMVELILISTASKSLRPNPQPAQGAKGSVRRKVRAFVIIHLPDVHNLRITAWRWSQPAMFIISDRGSESMKAPEKDQDVNRDGGTRYRSGKDCGSRPFTYKWHKVGQRGGNSSPLTG